MNARRKDKYIICVDDEKIILNSLQKQLRRLAKKEYICEFAESAEEAFQLVEELLEDGDEVVMVISDQIMPSMNGDELLVKMHKKYPYIVKIMLSGQAALTAAENAEKNANLFKFLTKPWDEDDLVLAVQKGLEQYSFASEKKKVKTK